MWGVVPSVVVLGLVAIVAVRLAKSRLSLFVAFNVTWIAIWMASIPFLRLGRRPAFFAAWFIAIAGVLNGIAHPMMAIASGGYFPGLVTSPIIGVAGVVLWQRLLRATSQPIRVM